MPNQLLLEQFNRLISQSKSFKLLDPVQQAEVKNGFITANDEQLQAGIEELKKDAAVTAKIDADEKIRQEKIIGAAKKMKYALNAIKKDELIENREKDKAESEEEAAAIISGLGKVKDTQPAKRKKLFGIF
jgi:hypothetical protein